MLREGMQKWRVIELSIVSRVTPPLLDHTTSESLIVDIDNLHDITPNNRYKQSDCLLPFFTSMPKGYIPKHMFNR